MANCITPMRTPIPVQVASQELPAVSTAACCLFMPVQGPRFRLQWALMPLTDAPLPWNGARVQLLVRPGRTTQTAGPSVNECVRASLRLPPAGSMVVLRPELCAEHTSMA